MPSLLYVVRVRISASHFAISEVFLRFCEANFIQEYKNAKLIEKLNETYLEVEI